MRSRILRGNAKKVIDLPLLAIYGMVSLKEEGVRDIRRKCEVHLREMFLRTLYVGVPLVKAGREEKSG